MSQKMIPEHIDPFRFAEQKLSIEGSVNIADMQRLSSLLYTQSNEVKANLNFGIDEQGTTFLKGHLETEVTLQCQRCMEPFNYGIISDFALGIVNTLDEANALPDYYEPAVTQDGNLALRDLLEDELILNLPIIPRHDPEECEVKMPLKDHNWQEAKKENPFQVLESLKGKRDNK